MEITQIDWKPENLKSLYKDLVDSKSIHLFILMMIDYILTYLGIHSYEFIQEGNPVLIWLFEIPIQYGIILRLIMAVAICFLFYVIYKSKHKHYNKLIAYALIVNAIILFLHIKWMSDMFIQIL